MRDTLDDERAVADIAARLGFATPPQSEPSEGCRTQENVATNRHLPFPTLAYPLPLAALVRQALDAARATCHAANRRFLTPDLLLAILELPGSAAYSCFENVSPGLGAWARTQLHRYLGETQSGPFVAFDWEERRDVLRAREIAMQSGAPAVADVHLLAAVLDGESGTARQLATLLCSDFQVLHQHAHCLSSHPTRDTTPGTVWSKD